MRLESVLKDYQDRAIEDLIADPFHGLFMEPGLGKTAIALEAFRRMHEACDVARMLVIAPLRVAYATWPQELAKWQEFRGLSMGILHGSDKADVLEQPHDIFVINPEGLPWLLGTPIYRKGKNGKMRLVGWKPGVWTNWRRRPECLVVDESTRFKTANTIGSKTLKRYTKDFGRRQILTGTPADNSLEDLHGQMLVIDRGDSLGEKITHYRRDFFYPRPTGYRNVISWEPQKGAVDGIAARIAPRITRLSGGEYSNLPERIYSDVPVRLPTKAMNAYNEIRRHGATTLAGGVDVIADSPMAKCRQIVGGCVYTAPPDQPEKEWQCVHKAKTIALAELMDELSVPPLISYWFDHERQLIQHELGADIPYIGGGVSPKRGLEIAAAWNAGKLRGLLIHPMSGGVGLNLQHGGNVVIFYTLPWTPGLYNQVIGRVHRQGQKYDTVFVYNLSASETVDQYVAAVLAKKSATETELLAAIERAKEI